MTLKMGQAPVIHYMPELYQMIEQRKLDPTDIITHRLPLEDAKQAYQMSDEKADGCIKVVLKPGQMSLN